MGIYYFNKKACKVLTGFLIKAEDLTKNWDEVK